MLAKHELRRQVTVKKQVNQHIFEKKCQREHRREHQKKCQRKPSVFIRTALSFLLASLMLFSLMACTTNGGSNQEKPAQPGVDPPSGPRIVVDMAGRSVELPDEVKAVAHTYGLAGNVLFAFGAGEMIVGMSGANDLSRLLYPGIVDVPSIGRNQVDLELLASIGPDIYIGRASNVNDLEAVQALGIPAIGISAENLDDIAVLYTLMGQILDQEEKAAELIAYYHSIYDKATELVSSVPDSQRKTAIVMGNNIATVAHEGMIQSEMIVAAGGISCVVGSDVPSNQGTWPAAGTETIFAWNPDFIFLTNWLQRHPQV